MKKHNERSKIENYEILWFNRHQTPIKKVTDLFADPKNLKEYQDGFIRKEPVSGKEGEVSKMYYKYGNREMELTETITKNELQICLK
ncbi:MAG: hypothetical protein O6943_10895 [Bacteroidetes bacterium]|nr:hypothetical protein [Bacteroidota bacterium]